MAITKIGPKHQITIPKDAFDTLGLEVGAYLEAEVQDDRLVLTPSRVVARPPAARLSAAEQRTLGRAEAKVEAIRRDLLTSKGLTDAETRVAAKAGLIDEDQAYWWRESWQRREREAEADRRAGRGRAVSGTAELDALFDAIEGEAPAAGKAREDA